MFHYLQKEDLAKHLKANGPKIIESNKKFAHENAFNKKSLEYLSKGEQDFKNGYYLSIPVNIALSRINHNNPSKAEELEKIYAKLQDKFSVDSLLHIEDIEVDMFLDNIMEANRLANKELGIISS